MRVRDCRIFSVRRHFGGISAVSCSNALIDVVRKHPVIDLMILPCNEASVCSWDVVGAVLVSPGQCQIIAA